MKMWQFLFLLTAGAVAWLGIRFGTGLYGYMRLSEAAPAHVESWGVEEVGPSSYAISATYFFEVAGKRQVQRYLFKPPYYPNIDAAEASISRLKGLSWRAWYDPRALEVSALQRYFPYKAAIHFGLALGVLLYFVWLYEYAKRLAGTHR